MRNNRFSVEQMIGVLKHDEKTPDLARWTGIPFGVTIDALGCLLRLTSCSESTIRGKVSLGG